MKTKQKTRAKTFYNSLKDDPEAILKWCAVEIKAYQELIRLVKGKKEMNPYFDMRTNTFNIVYTHTKETSECVYCGLRFAHTHPAGSKPKDFISAAVKRN